MSLTKLERVGVVGGGINAALFCLEAKSKGIKTTILDENMYCPASQIADEHLVVKPNQITLSKLIQRTDTIIFTRKLDNLSDYKPIKDENIEVYPSLDILKILATRQDFLYTMTEREIPVAPYKKVDTEKELIELLKDMDLPVSISKHYKSQFDEILILSDDDIEDFVTEEDKKTEYWVVEQIYLDSMELSVGVTRDRNKKIYTYSICEDSYDDGKWIQGHVPARINKTLSNKITALAKRAIRRLDAIGTFTVNISLTKDKEIYVRDILPFAQDSSVYTLESSTISQYDHWIRLLLDLDLHESEFDGVILTHLEEGTSPSNIANTKGILSSKGTNLYGFNGKSQDDSKILYTFKANTWEELENNIRK